MGVPAQVPTEELTYELTHLPTSLPRRRGFLGLARRGCYRRWVVLSAGWDGMRGSCVCSYRRRVEEEGAEDGDTGVWGSAGVSGVYGYGYGYGWVIATVAGSCVA